MAQAQAARPVTGPGEPAANAGKRTRNTPTQLWLGMLGAIGSILLLTAVAAVNLQGNVTAAEQTGGTAESRVVDVQELYFSLADADAAAATGILDSPAPSARFTQRYQTDIILADDELSATATAMAGDASAYGQLQRITEQFSQYTGLIGTAQADNRQLLPVGGAYLREASNLMQGSILSEVSALLNAEVAAEASSSGDSGGFALWPLVAGLVLLVVGVRCWRLLAARTRRRVNAGLAAGLFAAFAVLIWTEAASARAGSDSSNASATFQQVAAAQQARSDVAQISADEAASVVSRGADDGSPTSAAILGQKLVDQLPGLIAKADNGNVGKSQTDSALMLTIKNDVGKIQNDASAGNYSAATTDMVGKSTTTEGGALVDLDDMAKSMLDSYTSADQVFEQQSAAAANDYPGGPAPIVLLGLLGSVAAAYGFNRRIAEYR